MWGIVAHYLELDSFSVKFNGTDLEVDTDCGDERRGPGVIAEPE